MSLPLPDPRTLVDVCDACGTPYTFRRDEHNNRIRELCKVCIPEPTTLPDSGARSQFSTGAVRDLGSGKGWPSEIPPCFIRRLAIRYEDGGTKYNRGNWRLGIPLSRYIDAIFRHTLDLSEGKTDEDHAAAIGFNSAGFMWTLEQINTGRLPKELNDLPYHA